MSVITYAFNPMWFSKDFQDILSLNCLRWAHSPAWFRASGRVHTWRQVGSEVIPGLELIIHQNDIDFSIVADGEYFRDVEDVFAEMLSLPDSEEIVFQIDLLKKYLVLE